ncbi:hypothetical protein MIU24_25355 [Streptomyces venezuelae]
MSGRVVELVDGPQPGAAVGAGGGGDERGAVAGVVQAVHLDVPEGAGLLAGLAEFLDHPVPDDHGGSGVHEELDVGAAARRRAHHGGEHARGGAAFGGGLLVEDALVGAAGGAGVAAEGAEGLLESEEAGQGVGAGGADGQAGAPVRRPVAARGRSSVGVGGLRLLGDRVGRSRASGGHVEGDGLVRTPGPAGRACRRVRTGLVRTGLIRSRLVRTVGGGVPVRLARGAGRRVLRSVGSLPVRGGAGEPLGQPQGVRDVLGGGVLAAGPQPAGEFLQMHPVHPLVTSADRAVA